MSLLKCPKCGEMFSDSYKTCPFCEEDEAFANGGKKPVNPGRRVHRQKSPSILGPTLVLVLVLVAVMSFNPLGNMWSLISPYFALENNPWYYVMGAAVFCFAIYDVVVYAKLPKKPEVLDSGKKPIW